MNKWIKIKRPSVMDDSISAQYNEGVTNHSHELNADSYFRWLESDKEMLNNAWDEYKKMRGDDKY